jgi:hypothetical protein
VRQSSLALQGWTVAHLPFTELSEAAVALAHLAGSPLLELPSSELRERAHMASLQRQQQGAGPAAGGLGEAAAEVQSTLQVASAVERLDSLLLTRVLPQLGKKRESR